MFLHPSSASFWCSIEYVAYRLCHGVAFSQHCCLQHLESPNLALLGTESEEITHEPEGMQEQHQQRELLSGLETPFVPRAEAQDSREQAAEERTNISAQGGMPACLAVSGRCQSRGKRSKPPSSAALRSGPRGRRARWLLPCCAGRTSAAPRHRGAMCAISSGDTGLTPWWSQDI